jgi:hypothetical protein
MITHYHIGDVADDGQESMANWAMLPYSPSEADKKDTWGRVALTCYQDLDVIFVSTAVSQFAASHDAKTATIRSRSMFVARNLLLRSQFVRRTQAQQS